jgi:DNA repair protein RadC
VRLAQDMPQKEEIENPYSGHRDRLRERFLKSGLQGFHDYEVLELLLTFVISRKDTKPFAKDLIQRFKSLQGVLNADLKELQNIKGIKTQSALFLKIIQAVVSRYLEEKAKKNEIQFSRLTELVEYLKGTIGCHTNEIVRILYMNSQNELIEAEDLSEGTVNVAVVFPRTIVERALHHRATTVIMAHNHPGGKAEPSDKDDSITKQIFEALKTVDVSLQEHVIIAEGGYYSYRENGFLN